MIPFTNDAGLRDYHAEPSTPRRRWPWLVLLIAGLLVLFGVRR